MPESVDIFVDHMDIPELESGFINQYDIEGNIRMLRAFYSKTEHIAFISDNTYGGVTMQALVRKEMEKFPDLDLILMDGRKHTISHDCGGVGDICRKIRLLWWGLGVWI